MSTLTRPFENVPGKVLYRYVRDVRSTFLPGFPILEILLKTFPITKETEKGKWIDTYSGPKWVSNDARKKFAYSTEQEALLNLVKRSNKAVSILEFNLSIAKETARQANELYEKSKIRDKNE